MTPSSSDRSLNTMPLISRSSRSNYPSSPPPVATATLVVVSGPVRIFDTSSGENAISKIASGWWMLSTQPPRAISSNSNSEQATPRSSGSWPSMPIISAA